MTGGTHFQGVRALVVDDNVDHVDTLSMLLQLMGCETCAAYDGRTALHLIHHFRPDVVFFDLDMPGLDGCEAALMLQAEEPPLDTLLVCVTGRSEPSDEERCYLSGFDFFFSKPIDEAQIEAVLAAAQGHQTPVQPIKAALPAQRGTA